MKISIPSVGNDLLIVYRAMIVITLIWFEKNNTLLFCFAEVGRFIQLTEKCLKLHRHAAFNLSFSSRHLNEKLKYKRYHKMVFRENFELSLIFIKFVRSVYMHLWGLQIQLGLTPCRGGEAQGPKKLCHLGLLSLAGLTMPVWWKCRGLTKNSTWSSRLGVGQWFNNPLPQNLCITETETTTLAKTVLDTCLCGRLYVEAARNQQFTLDHSNSFGKIFSPAPPEQCWNLLPVEYLRHIRDSWKQSFSRGGGGDALKCSACGKWESVPKVLARIVVLPLLPTVEKQRYRMSRPHWSSVRSKEWCLNLPWNCCRQKRGWRSGSGM